MPRPALPRLSARYCEFKDDSKIVDKPPNYGKDEKDDEDMEVDDDKKKDDGHKKKDDKKDDDDILDLYDEDEDLEEFLL